MVAFLGGPDGAPYGVSSLQEAMGDVKGNLTFRGCQFLGHGS